MAQPYTIDLLISFAYAQAAGGRLRTFPHGLGMEIPQCFVGQTGGPAARNKDDASQLKQTECWKVKFDRRKQELLFTGDEGKGVLRVGDWIAVEQEDAPNDGLFHCRVSEVCCYPCIKVGPYIDIITHENNRNTAANTAGTVNCISGTLSDEWHHASIEKYEVDFDDLEAEQKRCVIKNLLECLPNVRDLKRFLSNQTTPSLAKWVSTLR